MTTIDLVDTNSNTINSTLVEARRRAGSPATGQVLTLVIASDESAHYDAMKAALEAAREHPSRILVVIARGGRGEPRLDAEVRVGVGGPGDTVVLRLHGQLASHADSVVLPLLLPDAPVVVWWPGKAPAVPGDDPLGKLAQRRLTDAAADGRPLAALARRTSGYRDGDTDLAWTRLTPWRALLAAALDQHHAKIESAEVEGERGTPSAELLAAWLGDRLNVPVERRVSKGPGLTAVRLESTEGPVQISRPDGRLAQLDIPGQPRRPVALRRRNTAELIAEELRHLDPDDVYAQTIAACTVGADGDARKGESGGKKERTE
jgi:glucose-6-phosphate dehydrogenase assembly protein OpcA